MIEYLIALLLGWIEKGEEVGTNALKIFVLYLLALTLLVLAGAYELPEALAGWGYFAVLLPSALSAILFSITSYVRGLAFK